MRKYIVARTYRQRSLIDFTERRVDRKTNNTNRNKALGNEQIYDIISAVFEYAHYGTKTE